MRMTVVPAGDADNVPAFLLRGPVREFEPVQIDTSRFSLFPSAALLWSAGIATASAALALGGYLMIAEGKQAQSATDVHPMLAPSVVSAAPVVGKPDAAPQVQTDAPGDTQVPAQTPTRAAHAEMAAAGGPEAPRQVTTMHFDADPSVWTDVRKFSPLPAEGAPALVERNPEPSPDATVSLPDGRTNDRVDRTERASEDRARRTAERPHRAGSDARHEHRRHASRRHRAEARQERSRRTPVRAADETAPDVGGTKMTAEQLRHEGSSANPVVNAFAGMLGPK